MLRRSSTRASVRGSFDASGRREGPIAELEAAVAVRCPHELGRERGQELRELRGITRRLGVDRVLERRYQLLVGAADPREEATVHREHRLGLAARVAQRPRDVGQRGGAWRGRVAVPSAALLGRARSADRIPRPAPPGSE